MASRFPAITATLAVATLIAVVASLFVGSFPIAPAELAGLLLGGTAPVPGEGGTTAQTIVWQIRVPRALAAVIVGAVLAAAGTALQSVFRNPLASPDLLGVSAGAALGAALAILLGWPAAGIHAAAFAGGLAAVALVWSLGSRVMLRDRVLGLVLTGIAIGSLFGALVALVKMVADPQAQLPAITFWLLGSFASVGSSELLWLAPAAVVGIAPIALLRWKADALALSDDEALALGVRPGRLRAALIAGATLATAAAVAAVGVIGWIGLVVPHAARLLVGAAFPRTLPVAMLLGALLAVAIDALGRGLSQTEVPPGVLTALIGAPALFLLMIRRGDA